MIYAELLHRIDNFNPRSHERSDNCFADIVTASGEFQSTLPREERQGAVVFTENDSVFQSTLPREERRWMKLRRSLIADFNPRSHERSDRMIKIVGFIPIFQSTLPREERLKI